MIPTTVVGRVFEKMCAQGLAQVTHPQEGVAICQVARVCVTLTLLRVGTQPLQLAVPVDLCPGKRKLGSWREARCVSCQSRCRGWGWGWGSPERGLIVSALYLVGLSPTGSLSIAHSVS